MNASIDSTSKSQGSKSQGGAEQKVPGVDTPGIFPLGGVYGSFDSDPSIASHRRADDIKVAQPKAKLLSYQIEVALASQDQIIARHCRGSHEAISQFCFGQ